VFIRFNKARYMKNLKLLIVIGILSLTGCQFAPSSHGLEIPIVAASEIYKNSQLTPSERCESIRIDKRANCRRNLENQTRELTEAMKREY
jgi:hypothetical protein